MFYNRAMKELMCFYDINWVKNPPVIYLVDSRYDFNLIARDNSESWEVGTVLSYNEILFFSPEAYEKQSCHKYSDEEYYFLIKHELSHLFYNIFSEGKGPLWLDEGFAIYTSGELTIKDKPKQLKSFLKYYSNEEEEIYTEAGFVVRGLIEKYGKEKVLDFVKLLPSVNSPRAFKKEFEKFFKINMDYRSIESIL
jgi:hypothetical protein